MLSGITSLALYIQHTFIFLFNINGTQRTTHVVKHMLPKITIVHHIKSSSKYSLSQKQFYGQSQISALHSLESNN